MIPSGFALGGLIVFGGDPGLNVMLVPLGGFALLYAIWLHGPAVLGAFCRPPLSLVPRFSPLR